MNPKPNKESPQDTLARIDREIQSLLKNGKLSRLDFGLEVSELARSNRATNLKALLDARRHYRELFA